MPGPQQIIEERLEAGREDQPQADLEEADDAVELGGDGPRRGDARQVERDDQPVFHARG